MGTGEVGGLERNGDKSDLSGMILHVLNCGYARNPIFLEDADYEALEKAMAQTMEHVSMRVLGY